jgi:DNA end-binding protein Ku
MASRPVWKGFIRFGLVSVPLKAYTAAVSGGGDICLNQLHKECHSRINYKKTCPIHGEVAASDIVSGYEFASGQYVEIDTGDLEKMRTTNEKAITVDAFIEPSAVDPRYFSGKSYFLLPDGPVAMRPYALLQRAMAEENRFAFGHVVFSGRDQLVLVRPLGEMLSMAMLSYAAELKDLSEFQSEVPRVEVAPNEMKLAKSLVGQMSEEIDLTQYKDTYTEKLTKLIETRVAGKEIVTPEEDAPQSAANLLEALEMSLQQAKKAAKKTPASKPPKLVAPSTPGTAAKEVRKRKTS